MAPIGRILSRVFRQIRRFPDPTDGRAAARAIWILSGFRESDFVEFFAILDYKALIIAAMKSSPDAFAVVVEDGVFVGQFACSFGSPGARTAQISLRMGLPMQSPQKFE